MNLHCRVLGLSKTLNIIPSPYNCHVLHLCIDLIAIKEINGLCWCPHSFHSKVVDWDPVHLQQPGLGPYAHLKGHGVALASDIHLLLILLPKTCSRQFSGVPTLRWEAWYKVTRYMEGMPPISQLNGTKCFGAPDVLWLNALEVKFDKQSPVF